MTLLRKSSGSRASLLVNGTAGFSILSRPSPGQKTGGFPPYWEERFQLSHREAPGPVEASKGKIETRQCPFLGYPCWVVIDTEDSQKSWLGESIRGATTPLIPPHPIPTPQGMLAALEHT